MSAELALSLYTKAEEEPWNVEIKKEFSSNDFWNALNERKIVSFQWIKKRNMAGFYFQCLYQLESEQDILHEAPWHGDIDFYERKLQVKDQASQDAVVASLWAYRIGFISDNTYFGILTETKYREEKWTAALLKLTEAIRQSKSKVERKKLLLENIALLEQLGHMTDRPESPFFNEAAKGASYNLQLFDEFEQNEQLTTQDNAKPDNKEREAL